TSNSTFWTSATLCRASALSLSPRERRGSIGGWRLSGSIGGGLGRNGGGKARWVEGSRLTTLTGFRVLLEVLKEFGDDFKHRCSLVRREVFMLSSPFTRE